jgi:UPF0755 protein
LSNKKQIWIPICSILGASALIAWLLAIVSLDIFGLREKAENVKIELKSTNMKTISVVLKANGIIKNRWAFLIYEKIYRQSGRVKNKFQTGSFVLNKGTAYNTIIRTLTRSIPQIETITIDFPSGSTVRSIAKKLEENGVCSTVDFFTTLEKSQFNYWFLAQIPTNPLRFNKYEGYFFPDKYEFFKNESPFTVIVRFFDNFEKKVGEKLRQLSGDLTADEGIILASIVEKETGSGEGTKEVAAIYLNRRANSAKFPRLESCPTRDYVNHNIKPYIDFKNQELYDAYNTYKCRGLPAGPISNPSLISIEAVINPINTEYFYFCSDENGKIYYGKTFAEHCANQQKAAEQNAEIAKKSTQQKFYSKTHKSE